MLPFMVEKSRQDQLKAEKSPLYNESLREICKSVINSISGKLLSVLKNQKFKIDHELKIMVSNKYSEFQYQNKLIGSDKSLLNG